MLTITDMQDPHDMAKAKLLEVQFQGCKGTLPLEHLIAALIFAKKLPWVLCISENQPTNNEFGQGMSGLPKSCYYVVNQRNTGLPKGRESYGNRVPIVVRGRESRPQGEGEQVTR